MVLRELLRLSSSPNGSVSWWLVGNHYSLEMSLRRSSSTNNPTTKPPQPQQQSQCHLRLRNQNTELWVGSQLWFRLGRRCVRRDGHEICLHDDHNSTTTTHQRRGKNSLGAYHDTIETFSHISDWELTYRVFSEDDDAPSTTTLFFEQRYLKNFSNTSVFPHPADTLKSATTGVASWFPSFQIPTSQPSLGFLEFNGKFIGGVDHVVDQLHNMKARDALSSGPLAIFNDECVVIMSTASSFMSTSSLYRPEWKEYGFGVLGSVTHIPANYSTSVILSSSIRHGRPDGIRHGFTGWGQKLQTLYGTQRIKDDTLDYLQYSTDNGAYYYYHKENPSSTYQDTMIHVYDYITNTLQIPIQSWLLDSWFYFKGSSDGGVKEWTARPDVFPNGGLPNVTSHLSQWKTMAHNRYWSTETVYAKQNGGPFDFVMEPNQTGLPLQEAFWEYLFGTAIQEWGLKVYEQDWLNIQTQSMNYTLQTVHGARNWLLQMGRVAERYQLPIQYCMSWPRHILQSLEINAVTQARASDDVLPDNARSLQLGVTSMVAHALGVTPHKDSFWSTALPPPDNPYHHSEHASILLSIIATYSTGPVTPSDQKEMLNKALLMKSCNADGRILKPDVPAVRTDASLMAQAGLLFTLLSSPSKQGPQVWSTYTKLSGYTWTYFLSAQSPAFQLSLDDVYQSSSATSIVQGYVAWNLKDSNDPTATNGTSSSRSRRPILRNVTDIQIPRTNRTDCQVYAMAPVWTNGWSLLGEATTKWTPVSAQRFSQLQVFDEQEQHDGGFQVVVHGAPLETVILWIKVPSFPSQNDDDDGVVSVHCTLPWTGRALFRSNDMTCTSTDTSAVDSE